MAWAVIGRFSRPSAAGTAAASAGPVDSFVVVVGDRPAGLRRCRRGSGEMIADSTSASSGLTTRSRSVSVLDGAICSSGMSSPVAGSRYWTRLWWDSSVSSSIRMPVWRRTSMAAQAQNARCSSRVRSRRVPRAGSSAQIRRVRRWAMTARRSVCPPAVNSSPGLAAARPRAVRPRPARSAAADGEQRGQDGQPLAGPLVHAGLAAGQLLRVRDLLGPDRAGRGPRPPPGRVVDRPLGDVEVERADGEQGPGRGCPRHRLRPSARPVPGLVCG